VNIEIDRTTHVKSTTTSYSHVPTATLVKAISQFDLLVVGDPFVDNYIDLVDDTPGLLAAFLSPIQGFRQPGLVELTAAGNIVNGTFIGAGGPEIFNGVVWQTPGFYGDEGGPPYLVCSVTDGFLNCGNGEGDTIFYGCLDTSGEEFPPSLRFFAPGDTPYDGCYPIKLQIVPPP
jgi:hypothetical protein